VPCIEQSVLGNSKHPLSTFKKQGFMGGEVLALAVQFLTRKGQWTASFHIPGREIMPHDVIQIPHSKNTEFLPEAPSHDYWEVRSSALADGTLGYYEVDTEYPDIDCNGVRVFPQGKIRHHVMPDRRLIPMYAKFGDYSDNVIFITDPVTGETFYGTYDPVTGLFTYVGTSFFDQNQVGNCNLIGLEFSDIEYPSDDIVGHRFLVSRRTRETKTIVDTGVIGYKWRTMTTTDNASGLTNNNTFVYDHMGVSPELGAVANVQHNTLAYYSPRSHYIRELPNGTHLDILGVYSNTFI
jgi:hypothetical protein